jgi:hypothetical protein
VSNKGIKHDQGKAPITLIPVEFINGIAEVFGFGAKKYGKHNFRLGMEHTRVLDAAMRHLLAIANGEDVDPESGMKHIYHAGCCLAMYAYFIENKVGIDDRAKVFLESQQPKSVEELLKMYSNQKDNKNNGDKNEF